MPKCLLCSPLLKISLLHEGLGIDELTSEEYFLFSLFMYHVIRKYTKQLLLGLEYSHRNGIMHIGI